jgi:hypothetical protein
MIECKANTNTLSDKQTDYIEKVYKITSGMAYVLRVTTEIKRQIEKKIIIDKLKRHIYTIEYPEHKVLYETNQIENIFRWFNTKGDTNEMSQHN